METSKCPKCDSEPRRDAVLPRRFLCGSYFLEDVAGVDDFSQSSLCAYRELLMLRAELARLKSENEAVKRERDEALGHNHFCPKCKMYCKECQCVEEKLFESARQLTAATSRAEALEKERDEAVREVERLREALECSVGVSDG
jgi:predicted RNase H-like nuclease (RuvC/YqgF family)